jgi:CubicO group peptidase (beta-lactamase class C family)
LRTGITGTPGRFGYSSAGSHLLSAILAQATGMTVLQYARSTLFDRLGIATRPAVELPKNNRNWPPYERAEAVHGLVVGGHFPS